MKKTLSLIVGLVLLAALVPGLAQAATDKDPFVTDLIAGRHMDVGDIKIWKDDQFLYVLIETVSPNCLMKTHLAVAWDLSGIPQRNGNPVPGRFPYKTSHNCATSFLYKIPLSDIPQAGLTAECGPADLYVAVHAVMNTGETAWGKGPGFTGKNWGTYIVYPMDRGRGVWADFSGYKKPVKTNESVEGWDTVAPNLNIKAKGQAVKIMPGEQPLVFGAPYPINRPNNGVDLKGGFSDWGTHEKKEPHFYTFTFAEGTSVSYFTLRMLDFGDFNPSRSKDHIVTLIAYKAGNEEVDKHTLSYDSDGLPNPRFSDKYGDLRFSGDAIDAKGDKEPGRWTWELSGTGIEKVILRFTSGYDPHIGFDNLCFVPEGSELIVK
jgi:hypothetical protein